jgi:putative ABC transport system ATP-binding protein
MIEISNVRKVFNQGRPNEFTAVDGIDLSVNMGNVTVLKGPSGSGKTTLLTILGCMARPTSGRIFLEDREITSLPERFLTEIRRQTFGFIFQRLNLIKGISAPENVMAPAYPSGEKFSSLRNRSMKLLDMFGLSHRAAARIEWLSGGEAQRVAIAREFLKSADFWFFFTGENENGRMWANVQSTSSTTGFHSGSYAGQSQDLNLSSELRFCAAQVRFCAGAARKTSFQHRETNRQHHHAGEPDWHNRGIADRHHRLDRP